MFLAVTLLSWQLLGGGYQLTADSAVDRDGNVYFTDAHNNRIYKIDGEGRILLWREPASGSHGIRYGPDGRLYAGQHDRHRIVAFTMDGKESVLAEGVQTHHLALTQQGDVYFAVAPKHEIWFLDKAGKGRVVTTAVDWPHALVLSPDGKRLFINDSHKRDVWSFEIQSDGSLKAGRAFCRLNGDDATVDPGGMSFDAGGLLYVATHLGVQICDAQGRVKEVIGPPGSAGVDDVLFAGPGLAWMYVTDGERMFRARWPR